MRDLIFQLRGICVRGIYTNFPCDLTLHVFSHDLIGCPLSFCASVIWIMEFKVALLKRTINSKESNALLFL